MATLNWDALVSAADAAAYIGIPVPQAASQDETNLYRLINGTSRAIRRWCERQFTPERGAGGIYDPRALSTDQLALGHQRVIDYDGAAIVKTRPYEARNITAVDLLAAGSGSATPSVLASDLDYVAMPRDKTDDGTYLWIAVRDIGNSSIGELLAGVSDKTPSRGFPSWPGGYAFRITGDWGMISPPDDVVEAALVAIDEEWSNPEGYQSRSAGEISATEIVPPARAPAVASPFPQRTELLLAPYRRGPEL